MDAQQTPARSRRDRFLKVAERRTKRVLRNLRLLGNCSVRAHYDYNEQDVERIFAALEGQIEVVRARFRKDRKEEEFSLR